MARNYTLTSFKDEEPKFNENLHSYMCYQREKCPKTGKLHWQAFVSYERKTHKKYTTIAKECNVENVLKSKGTAKQNRDYCSKKDSAIEGTFKEFGELTSQGERNDIKSALECKNLRDIEGEVLVKYGRGIRDYRSIHSEKRDWVTEVWILWGESGAGKSRYMDKNGYWKQPDTKWWDGYDGQEVVILDDWYEKTLTREYMLRLCDRYPLLIETKGGSVQFLAKIICITSNSNPWNWYGGDAAWRRRITFISEMTK